MGKRSAAPAAEESAADDPAGDESRAERLTQLLVEEFRGQLEEPLIRAIASDHDIVESFGAIYEILAPLAESSSAEEDALLRPGSPDNLNDLGNLEELHLDSDSRRTASLSSKTGLATSVSEFSETTELHRRGSASEIPDDDKVSYLQQTFPEAKSHTITLALRRARSDVGKAAEELLSREFLENSGNLQKGVDGFFRPDEQSLQGKGSTALGDIGSGAGSSRSILRVDYSVVSANGLDEELEGPDGPFKPMRPKTAVKPTTAIKPTTAVKPTSQVTSPNLPVQSTLPRPAAAPQSKESKLPASEWQVVTSKRKRLAKEAASETDAQTLAEEMRTKAASHYRAAAASIRRGHSDPLYRQAAVVHVKAARDARHAADAAAARAYDALVDDSAAPDRIDLHNLPVREGVRIARERVARWWGALEVKENEGGRSRKAREEGFEVVTGKGKHSKDGKSRLRQEVFAALKAEGWLVDATSGGCVVTGRTR